VPDRTGKAAELRRLRTVRKVMEQLWVKMEAEDLTPAQWEQLAKMRIRIHTKILAR